DAAFARLLLDHGADPNVRATLRNRLRAGADLSVHEYRDITPLSWGQRFHDPALASHDKGMVSQAAMRLIAERGGHDWVETIKVKFDSRLPLCYSESPE